MFLDCTVVRMEMHQSVVSARAETFRCGKSIRTRRKRHSVSLELERIANSCQGYPEFCVLQSSRWIPPRSNIDSLLFETISSHTRRKSKR